MIFDILGTLSFKSEFEFSLKDLPLSQNIFEDSNHIKGTLKSNNFQVAFLFRGNYEDSIFENEDFIIIIINEVLPKQNNTKFISSNYPFISSKELHAIYKQIDPEIIHYIKGNFQVIIHNKNDKSCKIFNNRFGISPFYYSFKDNILIFSTSLSTMTLYITENSPDKIGIVEYAIFGYPLGDRTLLEDIKILPPASYLIVKDDSVEIKKYWDLKNLLGQELHSEKEALEIGSE